MGSSKVPTIPLEDLLRMKEFVVDRLEASGLYAVTLIEDYGIHVVDTDSGQPIFVITHTSRVPMKELGELEDYHIDEGRKVAHIFYGDRKVFRQNFYEKRGWIPPQIEEKHGPDIGKTALELRVIEAWATAHHNDAIAYYQPNANGQREGIHLVSFFDDWHENEIPLRDDNGYPYSVHVGVPQTVRQISFTPLGLEINESDACASWVDAGSLDKVVERYKAMEKVKRNYGFTLKNLENIYIDVQQRVFDGQKQCDVPHKILVWLNPGGEISGLLTGISVAKANEKVHRYVMGLPFTEVAEYLINELGFKFPGVRVAHHKIPNHYSTKPYAMQERLEIISILYHEAAEYFMGQLGKDRLYSHVEAKLEWRPADYADPGEGKKFVGKRVYASPIRKSFEAKFEHAMAK